MNNKTFIISTLIGCIQILIGIFSLNTSKIDKLIPVTLVVIGLTITVTTLFLFIRMFYTKIKSSNIVIEGQRIDLLNMINLSKIRKVKGFQINKIKHKFSVNGSNLNMVFEYKGVCLSSKGMESFPFIFTGESAKNIENNETYGFDIKNDPRKRHKISPIPDPIVGVSKRVMLPFHKMIKKGETFHVQFYTVEKNCMNNYEKDFVISTLSFYTPNKIENFSTDLSFINQKPSFIRKYKIQGSKPILSKTLLTSKQSHNKIKFTDIEPDVQAPCHYVYMYGRGELN